MLLIFFPDVKLCASYSEGFPIFPIWSHLVSPLISISVSKIYLSLIISMLLIFFPDVKLSVVISQLFLSLLSHCHHTKSTSLPPDDTPLDALSVPLSFPVSFLYKSPLSQLFLSLLSHCHHTKSTSLPPDDTPLDALSVPLSFPVSFLYKSPPHVDSARRMLFYSNIPSLYFHYRKK